MVGNEEGYHQVVVHTTGLFLLLISFNLNPRQILTVAYWEEPTLHCGLEERNALDTAYWTGFICFMPFLLAFKCI